MCFVALLTMYCILGFIISISQLLWWFAVLFYDQFAQEYVKYENYGEN